MGITCIRDTRSIMRRESGRIAAVMAAAVITAAGIIAPAAIANAAGASCTAGEYKTWNDNLSINRVSSDCTLHIGPGEMQTRYDSLSDQSLGGDWRKIRRVVIDDPVNTRLPNNAGYEFNYPAAETVTGIDLIDTSNAIAMDGIIQLPSLTSDIDISRWDTSNVTSMKNAFSNNEIGRIKGIGGLDTSHVTNFDSAFYYSTMPTEPLDLHWNTSSVASMKRMFKDTTGTMPNIRGFDVSNVTSFEETFYQSGNRRTGPTGIDITGWRINTASPVSMKYMFSGLKDGITGLEGLDTSHVTDMSYMFSKAGPTRTIDLSRWDTSRVADFQAMFSETDLDRFSGFEQFDTGSGTDFDFMFFDIERSATTSRDLSHWDMSSAKTLESMFRVHDRRAQYMEGSPGIYGITGMDQWHMSTVTSIQAMFQNESPEGYRPSMDLSHWDVSGVNDMSQAFMGLDMSDISGIGGWDVSHVKGMDETFRNTRGTLDLSGWNTGSATNMQYMFADAQLDGFSGIDRLRTQSMKYMRGMFSGSSRSASSPIDLSGWDIGNVQDTSEMFNNVDMDAFPGVSDWHGGGITYASRMFEGAKATHDIDLSWMGASKMVTVIDMFHDMKGFDHVKGIESFDTSSVTYMNGMFRGTDGSLPLDLSRWDTGKARSFNSVFESMSRPISGYSRFNTGSATDFSHMFNDYKGGRLDEDLSGWDTGNVTDMRAMFDNDDIRGLTGIGSWDVSKVYGFDHMFTNATSDLLDVSGWVMPPRVSDSAMFMSSRIEAYRFGPHMSQGMSRPFSDTGSGSDSGCANTWWLPCDAWNMLSFTGRWSTLPSDREDASGYWTSTGRLGDADNELVARLKAGKAGTYVRERSKSPYFNANQPDDRPVSGMPSADDAAALTWPTSPTSDRLPSSMSTPSTRDWTFTGWNTKADGTGTVIMPGDVVSISEDPDTNLVILYAQWRRTVRKVRYDDGSGEASGIPAGTDVNSGDGYTVPGTVPSRPGYRMLGWSDDGTDTVRYRPGDRIDPVTEDITLHAVWRADPSVLPDASGHARMPLIAFLAALAAVALILMASEVRRRLGRGHGRHAA